jgi:integrase
MPTIVKRNGRFQAQVRVAGFTPQYETFQKRGDALVWGSRLELDMKEGRYTAEKRATLHTMEEMIDYFIKSFALVEGLNPQYVNSVKKKLEWWKRKLGKEMIASVTPVILASCRDELLSGGRRASTVNRYLSAISGAFAKAVEELKWLAVNPMKSVKGLAENNCRDRCLSEKELPRLLSFCEKITKKPLLLVVVLALATAARKTEILSMRIVDVHLKDKFMIARNTKNKETRTLFFDGFAFELLKAYMKNLKSDSEYLFPSGAGKTYLRIDAEFKAVLKSARISNFRFHDLRHTAASYLAMGGASLRDLAAVLGHKKLEMVKRYSHLTDIHCQKVVSEMNIKLFQGRLANG